MLSALLLLLSLLSRPTTTSAQTYLNEEFNQNRPINTLDNNLWDYFNSAPASIPTIQEAGGNLVLTQRPNSFRFPFIVSKNPAIPDGDFSTEIKFQYTKVTPYGVGISLSDQKPIYNTNNQSMLLNLSVWQDKTLGPNMRLQFNSTVVHSIPINTDPHIFKVERLGNKYYFYLDAQLVYTSPETPLKVKYIWLGNYGFVDPPAPEWTTLNIDYIHVSPLIPQPTATPSPTPVPTPTPTPKTPLIFIPGIGGTELKTSYPTLWSEPDGHGGTYTKNYQENEKVWANNSEIIKPGSDDYFDILRLKPDGVTPFAELGLTGTFAGPYVDTINYFNSHGYQLGANFFVFGYDWRRDIIHTSSYLNDLINNVMKQSGASKVDIIAHSMGGLVARNYIKDPDHATKVRNFFELGVPHLGSVKTLKALHYGDCLTGQFGPVCLTLNQSEVKDLFQNFISSYELLPSQKYYEFYNGRDMSHPTPFKDLSDIDQNNIRGDLDYFKLKNLLELQGHNVDLFNYSEPFQQALDFSETPGINTTIIAGSGIPTLGQLIETQSIGLFGKKVAKKDLIFINGDQTVPLISASLTDPQTLQLFSGNAKVYFTNQKHGDLIKEGPALELISNILNENSNIPSGVSTIPAAINGTLLSVHSPVNIDVFDQLGNHTGLDPEGNIVEDIPQSEFSQIDDAKFVWIPNTGQYNIQINATDNGTFDFKIRSYDQLPQQSTIYQNIPISLQSKAQLTFTPNQSILPVLNLDQNGDGIIDKTIQPTAAINGYEYFDQTPPEAKFYFDFVKDALIVEAVDQSPTTVLTTDNQTFLLTDIAGNSTSLVISRQDLQNKQTFELQSIQYNTNTPLTLNSNILSVTDKPARLKQNIIEQNFFLNDLSKVKIHYDQKKNQSKIIVDNELRETRTGIVQLRLYTRSGQVISEY